MSLNSNNTTTNSDAILDNIADYIQQLNAHVSEDLDRRAAGLYRAMFRHDTDINKLDFNYADHILSYVSTGIDEAVEDYKNYLQYLKCFNTEEYLAHKQMLEDGVNPKCEEDEE